MNLIQSAINMPSPLATTTLRLPSTLKAEADAYAVSLGISLNALLAVSLREYLSGRRSSAMPSSVELVTPVDRASLPAPAEVGDVDLVKPVTKPAKEARKPRVLLDSEDLLVTTSEPRRTYVAPLNPKWNCPCGSKKPWLKCHGKGSK